MMGLRNRVAKLAKGRPRFRPEDCPGGNQVVVHEGEPIPDGPPWCSLCGDLHVLVITEVCEGHGR